MRLRMTLNQTVNPSTIITEISHPGANWNEIATCDEPKFNEVLNNKLLYTPAADLPPAIRYLSPDHTIILFERPPGYVSFQYTKRMQEEINADVASRNILRLPLPWQRYVLLLSKTNTIANIFLFFSKNEIKDLFNDPMCVAPILNFYKAGRLCPASYTKMPEYEHSIAGAIDAAYDMIWHSGFNWDTVHAIEQIAYIESNPLSKYGKDYEKMFSFWSHQSLDTVLGWDWPLAYRSFTQLAESSDLYYEYAGKTDDVVVSFALSAQSARS